MEPPLADVPAMGVMMPPGTVQTTGPRPAIAGDMSAIVRHWARLAPEGEALRCGERAWTWAQLAGRVDRLTRALADLGVQAGQRLAVLDKNDPAHLEAPLAAAHGGFDRASVNLVAMPLFHVGGTSWALQSMYVGGRTLVVREVAPAVILEQIREQGVTHAFFVPTVYEFFLSLPGIEDADLSSVRCLGYGGSPMPGPLMRRCLDTFANDFYQVYGATEASGVFCVLRPEDHCDATHPERLASAGRPVSGVQLRVVDPDTGRDVEQGQTGEFWIKSAQTAIGYWNRPEDTAKAFEDGWYRTGDAGYVDAGGYVFVTDRTKDMVVTGGENVYPAEVERVLIEHPAIADASVIGVPDDVYGEAVKAVVIPEPGAAVDPAELIAFCRRHLAGYKCPKSVDVVDALPRNATGKVLKRDLRARYWADRNRAV